MKEVNRSSQLGRWIRRLARWSILALVTLAVVLLVGLLPVNNQFRQPEEGIQLFVVSNSVHADIIMPRLNGTGELQSHFASMSIPIFGSHWT